MRKLGYLFHDRHAYALPSDAHLDALAQADIGAVGLFWQHAADRDGNALPGFEALLERIASRGMALETLEGPEGFYDGEMREVVRRLIALAGAAGVKTVTLTTATACTMGAPETYFPLLREILDDLLAHAARAGVTLALRNGFFPKEGADRAEGLARMAEELSGAPFGLCLDTGVSNLRRAVLEEFYLMRPYLRQINLSDSIGGVCDRLQPGYGDAPWHGLALALDGMEQEVPLFLACRFFDGAPAAEAARETRALLDGRVYTRPDGGVIGRAHYTGRILTLDAPRAFPYCGK